MNLFDLNENYRKVESLFDDGADVSEQVLKDTLESIGEARDIKLDHIAFLIERNTAKGDFYAKKIKELQLAKKSAENTVNRLNAYMTSAMDDAGLKELQTENHVLKPRNYKASVVIDNTHAIPDQYMVSKLTIAPDKTAIYKALKAGEEVPGVHTKPNRKTVIK
ncbi:siphovirus Gp157 family protein [Ligilactobacillus ruminis]|mgnify:FL=1|uniref:siphovirus Gp157 family protein n=1 Tax=Ligilactobacillus ruminis TaxID=1623 RepID=UPI0022E78130|nr:siphovirus Gp157 family protein [Ligilactobacillus ruminis]